ncbi:MAG: hypothetical protein HQ568_05615 [Calditrichaeota bacterium]|nr:hypothetical protein [Calditrichota bacterium]
MIRKITQLLWYLPAFLIIISTVLIGCAREEIWEPEVIARVGDRTLTAGEVTAWEVSRRQQDISKDVRSAFIRHWVEEELLYRAAIDRKLREDAWVSKRLDELECSLLISRLLELEYRTIQQPSSNAVNDYFQQHCKEFTWAHIHLEIEYWRSNEKQSMTHLRSNTQRGRHAGIWTGEADGLNTGHIEIDGPDSASPEVWRIVSRMKVGAVSQVLHLNDEYWFFKLLDRREAGDQQGIDDVHDEIVIRLIEETRRQMRDDLVRKLIEEYRKSGQLYWSTQPRQVSIKDDSLGG